MTQCAVNAVNEDGYIWWKHGIIYQIYPRSYRDSNGDGTGDLQGIISRLDYLQELMVDALWLSPIFPSPMHDFGYDVSDYRGIHEIFGSLDDFRMLLQEAHARGIRILLDLVLNHSSDEHPWFQESRRGRPPQRDWYIWHPGRRPWQRPGRGGLKSRPGRSSGLFRIPPNNWMAAFGGRAWTWDSLRGEYYLHLFLPRQPDFNWRNPGLRREIFDMVRYWLELGVDGFRLDVINYLVKDQQFRSNPYRLRKAPPRRHDQQLHVHDRNQKETHEILQELRRLTDEYGATMLVGEIYPNEGLSEPEVSASYQGDGANELHLAFDFSLMRLPFRARAFRGALERWYSVQGDNRWPCHVLSNHDQSRAMTRLCGNNEARARLLAALILTQKGTPFLYYGEEIGMTDGCIPRNRMADPLGIRYWPFHPGRDPSRTPMQWDSTHLAGFSPAGESWLPVNPDYSHRNVAAQEDDGQSMLSWYKMLISLRRNSRILRLGEISFLPAPPDVLAYRRWIQGQGSLTVVLNFSRRKCPPDAMPAELREGLEGEPVLGTRGSGQAAALGPYEVRIVASPL